MAMPPHPTAKRMVSGMKTKGHRGGARRGGSPSKASSWPLPLAGSGSGSDVEPSLAPMPTRGEGGGADDEGEGEGEEAGGGGDEVTGEYAGSTVSPVT